MAKTTITHKFALDASPSHLLHRAQQLAAIQSADALKNAGITLRQFSVLAALAGEEGISQSRIVDMTGVDRSTLADMIARMETAGLVRRKQSKEDARAKSVVLSAKGRRILGKTIPAVSAADEALLNALPKNRQSGFLAVLGILAELSDKDALPVPMPEPAPRPARKTTKAKAKPKPRAKKPARAAKAKAVKTTKAAKPGKKPARKKPGRKKKA